MNDADAARVHEIIELLKHTLSSLDSLQATGNGAPSRTARLHRVELPDVPHEPHSYQLARYALELLRLSGVLTRADDPEHELWRRLDQTLTHLYARLTRGKDEPAVAHLNFKLKGGSARSIAALAAQFQCSRQAVVRQMIRQCPVESFPDGWVAEDIRVKTALMHQEKAP